MANYSKLRSDNPQVQQARQRAGRIVKALDDLATLIQEAWDNQDHKTLGYTTWQQYTIAEFGHGDVAVKARQIVTAMLRGTGLSQRAIAREVGTSPATVNNDLADIAEDTTVQPAEQPATVTGIDGRTRPATRDGMAGSERRERTRERRAEHQAQMAAAQAQLNAIDEALAANPPMVAQTVSSGMHLPVTPTAEATAQYPPHACPTCGNWHNDERQNNAGEDQAPAPAVPVVSLPA